MKALTIQSKIKRAINFVMLSKTMNKRSKYSLSFGIFGDFLQSQNARKISDRRISDFQISGQSLIKVNCHNS